MKSIWILLAFMSGAVLPLQAALNARLGKTVDNAVYASVISFIVGTVALLLYILLTRQSMSWAALKSAPAYVYLGGCLGAFYVTAVVVLFPKIGPTLTFGLLIAGQMIVSVVMDHFNFLVSGPHPFNWWRMAGVLLIIAGVILVRRF